MSTKRHTNFNFIIAIRNILLHYETKSENIIRKDFVTKVRLNFLIILKIKILICKQLKNLNLLKIKL